MKERKTRQIGSTVPEDLWLDFKRISSERFTFNRAYTRIGISEALAMYVCGIEIIGPFIKEVIGVSE